jgi:signal transduction histidine kinase
MKILESDTDLYLILLSATILLTGLTGFIIYFLVLYRKKQVLHLIEQERLAVKFQQEMLNTQIEIQEQTMQTIGADLHDNIGQLLSLTSLTLNSVELEGQPKAKKKVDAAIDLTLRSIKELRQLGKLLQGDQLIAIGLAEAIRHEIDWVERAGKFQVTYVDEGDIPKIGNADKDLIIFRILQEALNNIIKHASASHINIRLEYHGTLLHLHINDNGIGFDTANLSAEKQGMGLHNIHKRAGIIGGEVLIRSNPGEGTGITIIIPYP